MSVTLVPSAIDRRSHESHMALIERAERLHIALRTLEHVVRCSIPVLEAASDRIEQAEMKRIIGESIAAARFALTEIAEEA